MENNYYIYIYTRLDNNTIFYVGKGKDNRCKDMYSRNDHFINIVNKVNYKVEFLYDNLTNQQALDLEVDTIHHLVFNEGYGIDIKGYEKPNEIKHLCNQTWGGEGTSGYTWTEEQIRRGENHPMFGKNHSEEWKQEHSERMSGGGNPMFGKNHSEEAKKKQSENHMGWCPNEETRKRMSESHMGEKNHMYGKCHSDETIQKLKEIRRRRKSPVICITTKKIFDTAKEGSEYYNCSDSGVIRCCKGYTIRKGKRHNVNYCGKLKDGTRLVWRYLKYNHDITLRGKDILKLHKNNTKVA